MQPTDDPRGAVLDLFREHGAAIYRFASALTRSAADAEDVVQETFLKLLQHLGSGGDVTNIRAWLFTVSAHACRDRLRGRRRWVPWSAATEPSAAPWPLQDEDGRLQAAREGLSRLSTRDRLLLSLRAQGLSYRDIARAANVRPTSVGRLLARALDRWERVVRPPQPIAETYRRSPS